MSKVSHYKLFKAGKLWCTMLITAAVVTVLGVTAHAANNQVNQPGQVQQTQATTLQTTKTQSAVSQTTTPASSQNQANLTTPLTKNYHSTDGLIVDYVPAEDVIINGQNNRVPQPKVSDTDLSRSLNAADTSLHVQNGELYYLRNGQRQANAFYTSRDGNVYYFGNNGVAYRNRFYHNWGKTYYFDDLGQRATNMWYYNWGNYYYFGSDGALYTDQFLSHDFVPDNKGSMDPIGDEIKYTYYFMPRTGILARNYFLNRWGHTYYFGTNGARYTNHWYRNWGHRYYFGEGGVRINGTGYDGPHLAYKTIDGNVYAFNRDGVAYTGFLNAWGHLYYFASNGARYTNREYQNWGHKYYFGADGVRYTNQFRTVNGKVYYYDHDGVMYQNRFFSRWGHIYYFGPDGARYTDQWLHRWGHDYYYGDDGALVTNTEMELNHRRYRFDRNGIATVLPNKFESFQQATDQVKRDQAIVDEDQQAFAKAQGALRNDPTDTNYISLPNGYTRTALATYRQNPKADVNVNLLNSAQVGRDTNQYRHNAAAAKDLIKDANPAEMTEKQQIALSQFAAHLLNPLRQQLGTDEYTVSRGSVKVAQDVANGYSTAKWDVTKKGHDTSLLNNVANHYGLIKVGEVIGNSAKVASQSQSSRQVANMDQAYEGVYNELVKLLFNDKDANFADAASLLLGATEDVRVQHGTSTGVNTQLGIAVDKVAGSAGPQWHFVPSYVAVREEITGSGNWVIPQNHQKIYVSGHGSNYDAQSLGNSDPQLKQRVASAQRQLSQAQATLTEDEQEMGDLNWIE